jgi:hypothetical protein
MEKQEVVEIEITDQVIDRLRSVLLDEWMDELGVMESLEGGGLARLDLLAPALLRWVRSEENRLAAEGRAALEP